MATNTVTYTHTANPYPGQRVDVCNLCGCPVYQHDQHEQWHRSLNVPQELPLTEEPSE